MKFFVDANLPYKLVKRLQAKGFDVIHTDNLPNRERTTDKEIRNVSVSQQRIVISKDSDFLDSHIINGIPEKLLIVSTGNITNKSLFILFEKYFADIVEMFNMFDLIEITNNDIIVHEK